MIEITKKDVIWNYLAQIFSLVSGLITLPLILRLLTTEEIALNYIFLTIQSLVLLFDFGFSPQFSRNVSYAFSGVKELKKEGIEIQQDAEKEPNYRLVSILVKVGRFVYLRLALLVFFTMLVFGSFYVYRVTKGFTSIDNVFLIWVIFSLSTAFNIYYEYYNFLLTGKGAIKETKIAMVTSKVAYITLTFLFLLLGWGLMGVVLANFIAPFVNRYISYKYLFTKDFLAKINQFDILQEEVKQTFSIIWYNAKKLGLVFVGGYVITKFSMFLAGLYLSSEEIASYGLMIQLVGVISGISITFFMTFQPKFAMLRIKKDKESFIRLFAFSVLIFTALFLAGSIGILFLGNFALTLIKSNVLLPSTTILLLFLLISFLESNHSNFATIILTKNDVPFVKPALISGVFIVIGTYLSLRYTNFGILGLVVVQGICQLAYNNWKWPLVVFKDFEVSLFNFMKKGFEELLIRLKNRK